MIYNPIILGLARIGFYITFLYASKNLSLFPFKIYIIVLISFLYFCPLSLLLLSFLRLVGKFPGNFICLAQFDHNKTTCNNLNTCFIACMERVAILLSPHCIYAYSGVKYLYKITCVF